MDAKETYSKLKKFFKFFPFILTFVLLYLLQVKLDADNRHLPFLEPFGRTAEVGTTDLNREAQALGDGKYVWLQGPNLVFAELAPDGSKQTITTTPAPDTDIRTYTKFKVLGDDVFWIGKNQSLKRSTRQGKIWSTPEEIGQLAVSLDALTAGDKDFLFVGQEKQLSVYRIHRDKVELLNSFPTQKIEFLNASADNRGTVHIGGVEILSAELVNLRYLTLDPATGNLSAAAVLKDLTLPSQTKIDDHSFGIDNTHGYFLMTEESTKTMDKSIKAYAFDLTDPQAGTLFPIVPKTAGGGPTWSAYEAVAAPGQQDQLTFAFIAGYEKNNRVGGLEMFLSSLDNGAWNEADLTRVSNTQRLALNPAFSEQDGHITVLYNVLYGSKDYRFHFNSSHPDYAKATNVLTGEDYKQSALAIPEYLVISFVLLMIAIAWPMASYAYLFWFVWKNEDVLHSQPERHLLVAIVLYLASQIAVFLNYGKLENLYHYAPEWMHTPMALTLLMVGAGVVSYLFTILFRKLSYERSALNEFSYFTGLNIWIVLIGLSYFMAG